MKKFLFLAFTALTLSTSAQLTDEVARLDSTYGVAVQISDDPVTGFQRIATHRKLEWDSQSLTIGDSWMIYLYKNDTLVKSQSIRNPFERALRINRHSYIDSTNGAPASQGDTNAVNEYWYFYNAVNDGANLIQLIRQQVARADSLGKFD